MFTLITEVEGAERQHREAFENVITQLNGTVRIASAYVTDTKLLANITDRDIRLLTYLTREDIIAGASSLDALAKLIKAGVKCWYLSNGPRLHAKVYLFDDQLAVVTSANLTRNALDKNLEVGVQLSSAAARQLIGWFDSLWDKADQLDLATVSKWRQETETERAEYSSRRKRAAKAPLVPAMAATTLGHLFKTANRLFVCNTNRRSLSGDEDRMHDREYAAAWERFNFPSHMDRVKRGDAILMYAKGVGIIGIGRAKGPRQILEPDDPDRITQREVKEWRIPVAWLAWTKESQAYKKWKSQNGTFFDVSEDRHLRKEVEKHFLGIKPPSQ